MTLTLLFFIVVALLLAASSFLSSTGDIIDKERKGLKAVTIKGWILLVLNFGILLFSVLQYRQNDIDVKQKEEDANNKQLQRDSILREQYNSSLYTMKQKYDESHKSIVLTIANALGKYGYQLDSSNKILVKLIRDSSKTKVILPDDPVLIIDPTDGIKLLNEANGIHHYQISVLSTNASSAFFNIKCFFVVADSLGNYYFVKQLDLLSKDDKIPKDFSKGVFYEYSPRLAYSFLYVLLRGNYKNYDGTKSFEINDLYYYNKIGKTFGGMSGKTRTSVIECINKNIN
jgi:hypothetical protein